MIKTIGNTRNYGPNTSFQNDWNPDAQNPPIIKIFLQQVTGKSDVVQNCQKNSQVNEAFVRGLWKGKNNHLTRSEKKETEFASKNNMEVRPQTSWEQDSINYWPSYSHLNKCLNRDDKHVWDDLFERILLLFLIMLNMRYDVEIIFDGKHVELKCMPENSNKNSAKTIALTLPLSC